MLTLIAVIAALIIGICAGLTYAEIKHMRERIAALEAADGKKHLPYQAAEQIEDGLAALNYIIFDDDLQRERIQNAVAHFQAARSGK